MSICVSQKAFIVCTEYLSRETPDRVAQQDPVVGSWKQQPHHGRGCFYSADISVLD